MKTSIKLITTIMATGLALTGCSSAAYPNFSNGSQQRTAENDYLEELSTHADNYTDPYTRERAEVELTKDDQDLIDAGYASCNAADNVAKMTIVDAANASNKATKELGYDENQGAVIFTSSYDTLCPPPSVKRSKTHRFSKVALTQHFRGACYPPCG